MITLAQLVGMLVAALSAAAACAAIVRFWPLARLGKVGTPVLAAAFAAPCAFLLQLLGAGDVGFRDRIGVIDWIPVVSTLITGALIGLICATAIGLMRMGSRGGRRRL